MNIRQAVKNYFSKMISLAEGGMKVLMLDQETLKFISVVSSMSEIMKQDVYLIERIDLPREPLEHLKCICFVRPTKENIGFLIQELRKPNYTSYYIYFSHSLTKQLLKQLAEADENELVVEVQEYFADYIALSPFLFELDIPVSFSSFCNLSQKILVRATDGLTAVLLSLKKCPVIRYQSASEVCRQLAESIRSMICRESILFDFRHSDPAPLLLILDRRQDSVTPLLTQWTYEAMVHELIGISQNRVSLVKSPNVSSETREVTLDREFDEFYRANQFSNFGEIGQSILGLVENFQKASKSVDVKNLESITDLKKFLEHYPSFRKASSTVDTHVTLITELSRIVKEHALMEVSEVEQELICHDNHSSITTRIRSLLNDPRISLSDALRIVLLYALRYENQKHDLDTFIKLVRQRGATDEDIKLVKKLTSFSWPRSTSDGFDLFSGSGSVDAQSAAKAMASLKRRFVQGLKGVDNVYTQHEPLLTEILKSLIKGQLKESSFPSLVPGSGWSGSINARVKEVIIFIIGGVTHEEAYSVHKLNKSIPDVDFILGGTCVHNSRSFLTEVSSALSLDTSTDTLVPGKCNTEHTHRGHGKTRQNIHYGLLQ